MIIDVYAVRDLKTSFNAPFVDISDESAIRGFSFSLKQENSLMKFAPEDYELYKIGQFDSVKGVLIPLDLPVRVVEGREVV